MKFIQILYIFVSKCLSIGSDEQQDITRSSVDQGPWGCMASLALNELTLWATIAIDLYHVYQNRMAWLQ